MPSKTQDGCIYQFKNCHILSNHKLVKEDVWVRNGKILNPEKLFFDERAFADVQVDCQGNIISPGYIDTQINGRHYFRQNRLPSQFVYNENGNLIQLF